MSRTPKPKSVGRTGSAAVLRTSRRTTSWVTPVAVGAVMFFAAAVGIGVYLNGRPNEVTVPPGATAQGVVMGEADAPVTIDLYEDFQCPACRQFEQRLSPTIDELVASDTANVVFHPVAFLDRFSSTNYSSRSSAAAGCAAAAGVFAEFADLLFANQPPEGGDGLPIERLIELGRQAGATGDEFATCVREERYAGWTARLTETASQRGVNQTPTVLVDGQPLPQRTPEALRQAVQTAA